MSFLGASPALARGAAGLALFGILAIAAAIAAFPVTAHSETVDSGMIPPGGNWSHVFYLPGTFDYHCHPHPWMEGTVTIDPSDPEADVEFHTVRIVEPSEDTDTWGYEPAELTIKARDRVTWVNEGAAAHTVTQMSDEHADDHGAGSHTDAEAPAIPAVVGLVVLAGILGMLARRRR